MMGTRVAAASTAVMILGGAGVAFAADLATKAPAYKAPDSSVCTSILDFFTTACQVSAYGVRFYGTIDVGGSYQTNGASYDRFTGSGLTYTPQKMNNGAKWLPANYAMQGSNIGFQITEPLGGGWKFVGQVEAAFDPFSLALKSGSQSLRDDVGQTLGTAKGVADSSLQGTFYDSLGFAGFSHDTWGTLTFGRQNEVFRDVMVAYDPAGGSNGFGLIGGNGSLAGAGSTETQRGTTSVKYRLNFANYRLGLFAQFGGYDEGNPAKGVYQASLGGDFKVGRGLLSIDGSGGFSKDAVSESLVIGGTSTMTGIGDPNGQITGVSAAITDNTYAEVGVKYTIDRLKLYAGYEWIQFANPADGGVTSFTDIAGNAFAPNTPFVVAAPLANNKIYNFAWGGARYSVTDAVDVYGAYYHLDQNQFGSASQVNNCLTAGNDRLASQCHGTQDAFTAVVDWKLAPKWDTYLGTTYNHLAGGLANGYLHTDFWATTAGIRFRW